MAGEGADVSYWNLIFIGAMVLLAVIFFAFFKNKKSKIDPKITEDGTRRVYEEEQRIHKRDPGSGL